MTERGVLTLEQVALVVVFAAFVLLGLPEGVQGTAWPGVRADLGRPVSDLGWLVGGYTAGYVVSTAASGHLTSRWGTGTGLAVAVTVSAGGLLGYAATPTFTLMVVAAFVLGTGAGLLDAAVNAWVAVRHGARAMGLLHAFFGVGATLGPLAVSAVLVVGASWRVVYGAVAVLELVVAAVVWSRRSWYAGSTTRFEVESVGDGLPAADRLLRLTLAWFFLYVGVEVSVGAWSYSLLTEQWGVAPRAAALWVAGYWGGLMVGRFVLGWAGPRVNAPGVLRISLVVAVVGAVLLWADLGPLGEAALPLLGLSYAAMFPLMVLLTPEWLGAARTQKAVGYQLTASSLGAVASVVVVGGLAGWRDLTVLGPFLTVMTLLMGGVLIRIELGTRA
ncbi:MAG: MFS transporter [Actinomycetia bacterium]|nr:MFS transporter [Actinomycetes bacterium]